MRTVTLFSLALLGFSGTALAGTATSDKASRVETAPTSRMPAQPTVQSRGTNAAPSSRSGAPATTSDAPIQPTVPTADAPMPSSGTESAGGSVGGGRSPDPVQTPIDTGDEPDANPATTVGGSRDGGKKGKKNKRGKGKKNANGNMHGTLIYGPTLDSHDKYANAGNKKRPTVVAKKDLPDRNVNRKGSLAAGIRGGTLMHGYTDGNSHSDLGLGVMARYRPTEAMGLQLDLTHHADTLLGAQRGQTLLSGSAEVFVFPWNNLSPYALVGVTSNGRGGIPGLGEQDNMTGAHVGAGLEIAFGGNMAFDVEARYIGWLNQDAGELANPGAVSANAGLVFHF